MVRKTKRQQGMDVASFMVKTTELVMPVTKYAPAILNDTEAILAGHLWSKIKVKLVMEIQTTEESDPDPLKRMYNERKSKEGKKKRISASLFSGFKRNFKEIGLFIIRVQWFPGIALRSMADKVLYSHKVLYSQSCLSMSRVGNLQKFS